MKIVFCGTPDYAVPSLKRLAALAPTHQVVAVVSQPDKPKGRTKVPTPPPVVVAAKDLGFTPEQILQPKSINKPDVIERLRALAPDLLCVVAYGGLLRKDALELAKFYPINAHGSLLPKHRGASPIQASLLAGDTETGVCIIKMEAGLDTGPVILRRAIPIAPDDDAGSLHDKLAELSAQCFVDAVEIIARGEATFEAQDNNQATYAAKLEKNSGNINWSKNAAFLVRHVRAMNPCPGAWTTVSDPAGGQRMRVRVARAAAIEKPTGANGIGVIRGTDPDVSFEVACDSGALAIREIQQEGKRQMSVAEFIRGAGRKFVPESKWE